MKKKIKIAIIDDHPDTVTSLSMYLENIGGFETVWAYNGEKGVALCKKEKPDLLILDIKMPGMNGYDVAKALPKQKIFFMTGYDIDNDQIKKFKNVLGILKKPVDIEILQEKIRKELKLPKSKQF